MVISGDGATVCCVKRRTDAASYFLRLVAEAETEMWQRLV